MTIEIVNETIPFGILALIAQNYRNRDKVISILKAGLVLHVFLSLLLMSIVILFAPQFVSTIGTPKEIVDVTKNYLILKSISLPFESVAILLLISIKAMQKGKEALYLATFSVLLNVTLDMILISNFDFSLHLGITGVAIGYVISNIAYMLACLIFIIKILKINLYEFIRTTFKDNIKPIFKIGGWTGLDSLVRNVGYIGTLMVLNLIGINEFGGYGLAMTVMWTVIIPVLALTEGTNVAIGNSYGDRKYRDIKMILITSLLLAIGVMFLVAAIGIFLWDDISAFFNPNPYMINYSIVTFWWLIIPYTFFAIGSIIRSLFIGTGQTKYIFYISLILNGLIIGPFVLLVKMGILNATYTSVMALFTVVFAVDPILAYLFARRAYKKMVEKVEFAQPIQIMNI